MSLATSSSSRSAPATTNLALPRSPKNSRLPASSRMSVSSEWSDRPLLDLALGVPRRQRLRGRGHQPYPDRRIPQSRLAPQNENRRIDSVLIAEYLRFANPESSKMANPDVEQLRELARFRSFLVEQATQLKNKAIRVLDQAFPEYGKLFSNTFGEASKALLKQCPTPEEVLATDIRTLTRILKENSGGNCGRAKAEAVKDAARSSIGAKFGARALSFEIKLLVKRLSFTQVQIEELEDEISELLHRSDGHWLTTIPASETRSRPPSPGKSAILTVSRPPRSSSPTRAWMPRSTNLARIRTQTGTCLSAAPPSFGEHSCWQPTRCASTILLRRVLRLNESPR